MWKRQEIQTLLWKIIKNSTLQIVYLGLQSKTIK